MEGTNERRSLLVLTRLCFSPYHLLLPRCLRTRRSFHGRTNTLWYYFLPLSSKNIRQAEDFSARRVYRADADRAFPVPGASPGRRLYLGRWRRGSAKASHSGRPGGWAIFSHFHSSDRACRGPARIGHKQSSLLHANKSGNKMCQQDKTSPGGSSAVPIRREVKRLRVAVENPWLRKGEY